MTLTYTITVTDSQGTTDTQDVVITINGTNDAPVVTIETGDSAAETLTETDTTLTTSGTLTTTDLDLQRCGIVLGQRSRRQRNDNRTGSTTPRCWRC